MLKIKYELRKDLKPKPKKDEALGFGNIFTDHMFIMNYSEEKGWHDAKIVPYDNISLPPSAMVLHYGQEMFEGLKAYYGKDGNTYLFRPDMNAKRTNITNKRICIPQFPEEYFTEAVKAIVKTDIDWVPKSEGASLYIRPFIIATDSFLGVAPSKTYLFMIILSPSGAYYETGLDPVSIWIEDEYVRSVKGGMGFAKSGGNYAGSLAAQVKAYGEGYAQVLWIDGAERKYIEEVGSMNIFFKIRGKIVTPALNGSILAGITRDSVIKLCESWGYAVEERRISIDELVESHKNGLLEEVCGTGTAAVISPVGKLRYRDNVMTIKDGGIGHVSQRIYDTLTQIQWGEREDPFGWRIKI